MPYTPGQGGPSMRLTEAIASGSKLVGAPLPSSHLPPLTLLLQLPRWEREEGTKWKHGGETSGS